MRTPEEIEQWLIWNGVLTSYRKYAEASGMGYVGAVALGENAIKGAFVWSETVGGSGYWDDVNNRYQEWYRNGAADSMEHE